MPKRDPETGRIYGKNANGRGSVYRRAIDGRWAASVSYVDPLTGQAKRRVYYAADSDGAYRLLRAAQRHLDDGQGLPSERETVADYLRRWMETLSRRRRPQVVAGYRAIVEHHLIPAFGHRPLQRLQPVEVNALYAKLEERGLAPNTIHRIHSVLHLALKQAEREQQVPRNVAALVEKPKPIARREGAVLSPPQARAFVAACASHRLEALFVVAITFGLREGELLGLRWCAVDLDRGTLLVDHQLQRLPREGQVLVPYAKTKLSCRTINLSPNAADALRRWRKAQAAEQLAAPPGTWSNDLDLVFTRPDGRPLRPQDLVRQDFKPLLPAAGLPPIRFHDLRHTACTLALAKGVPVITVSRMLGHSSTAFTQDRYGKYIEAMREDAARVIGEIYGD